jgi:DNA processing protein
LSKLSFEQLVDLFLLLSVDKVGPSRIRSLLSKFKNFNNIFDASLSELEGVDGISFELGKRIKNAGQKRNEFIPLVENQLNSLNKINAKLISFWDVEYPALLKKIYDPPLLLYIKGSLSEKDNYSIAAVGTRNPTNYGKVQTERIISELALQGITIVSGLARGIDSIAHETALKNGSRTIAVIGSGLDVIYPPENKNLFNKICENGLIISEFPMGTKPDAPNFPRRNRIISGISLGVIVFETAINGGAMQTAHFALDQNREVFAIPGNLGIRQSEGTNLLIQKGEAELIINAEDVLNELQLKLKPVIGKNIPHPEKDLNVFEEKIFIALKENGELQIDKLSELTNLSTSDCLVNLLTLEFKGLVKQLPGKIFSVIV